MNLKNMQLGVSLISGLFVFGITCGQTKNTDSRVIILGAPVYSVAKIDLIDAFFPFVDTIHQPSESLLTAWGCDVDEEETISVPNERPSNVSCLIVSSIAIDQMNLDQISTLFNLMSTEKGLAVVELGEPTVQLRALLGKKRDCWGIGVSDLATPNRVYLCGQIHPNHLPALGIFDVTNVGKTAEAMTPEVTFWPCIFASAAKAENKHRKRSAEVEEPVIVEEENEGDHEEEKKTPKLKHSKMLQCKYRRSCYESGELPEIKSTWEWPTFAQNKEKEADDRDEETDEDEESLNLVARKLKCKYRKNCYERVGIPVVRKEVPEEKVSVISGKHVVPAGKKKTIKEIAEKTLKKVKDREEEAKDRELPNSLKVERKLEAIGRENNKKLTCKYRKSCYESGKLPELEENQWSLPSFSSIFKSTETDDPKVVKEIRLDELGESERKFRCKYRKSCIETGILPEIPASSFDLGYEFWANKFDTTKQEAVIVDDPNQSLQTRCKYRLSCYETGILPDLTPKEVVEPKQEASSIPTSMTALKAFCKYRKSCYEKIALSDGLSAVKEIRKTRDAEKAPSRASRRVLDEVSLKHKQSRREKLAAKRELRLTKRVAEEKLEEIETPKQQREKIMAEKERQEKEVQHKNKHYAKEPVPIVEEEEPEIIEKKEEPKEPKEEPAPKKKSKKSKEKVEPEEKIEQIIEPEIKAKPEKIKKRSEPVEETTEKPKKKKKASQERVEEVVEEKTPVKEKIEPEKPKRSKKVIEENEERPREIEPSVKEALGLNAALFESLQQQRTTCKYRKSCYASGKVPDLDRGYMDVFEDFNRHVEKQYESELQKHLKGEDKKLACKYRKSCYETGRLSITREELPKPTIQPVESPPARKLTIQEQCKYRKSCYEKHGLVIKEVDERVQEDSKAKPIKATIEKPKPPPPVSEKAEGKKKKKETTKRSREEREDESEEKEKEEKVSKEEVKETKERVDHDLSTQEKYKCKYRKSCYSGTQPPEPIIKANEDKPKKAIPIVPIAKPPPGVKPRDHCHFYWFSCREWLGLPPKEKAPIGPNGKRLCRKKK